MVSARHSLNVAVVLAVLFMALSFLTPGRMALAQSPAEAARSAGLLGTWAADCSKPPSLANWHVVYETTADGGVRVLYQTDQPDFPRGATVDRIRVVSPTTVTERVHYSDPKWGKSDGAIFDIVLELTGNRRRTLLSTRTDGVVLIRDARVVGSGKPAVVEEKCAVKPVS